MSVAPSERSDERILALETSTMTASVAVLGGAHEIAFDYPVSAHSDDLLALLDRALTGAGIALADLTAIAVGAGPGSFTGLRIGMATAKGLCFASGIPLWAVSSLAALALDAALVAGPRAAGALLVPVLDARRGEVFAGFYRAEGARVIAVAEERVIPVVDLAAQVGQVRERTNFGAALMAGDALSVHRDPIAAAGQALQGVRATPSAHSIAQLALAGQREDVLRAGTPVYIRPSEAEVAFPAGNPGGLPR
jgi:tRNA threonylcarbamoyladenosine biosynthesis protein TsaB